MSGYTALGALQPEQKRAWLNEAIRVYREQFFFKNWLGTDENSVIQLIKELKKTEKGDRAMIGLVPDMVSPGVVGDNTLEDREDSLEADWIEIHCDQLRNGVKSKGRVDNQRSVLDFRKEARDKLGYWRANIIEQLLILTASGVQYSLNTDGSPRQLRGQDNPDSLEFASDVAAPSSERHYRFTGTGLAVGDTTQIASGSVPSYGALVDLHAEARYRNIKPIRIGGQDCYIYLCHPKHFALYKKDQAFREAIVHANERGMKHPILTGATVTMDGLIFHTNNRVFNTLGAASGAKWGSANAVNGTRSLLMGAQALGFADLWGSMQWFEGKSDHDAKDVISVASYIGMLKTRFKTEAGSTAAKQDFGLLAVDSYIA
jgi:N4-gp56 family major capsid protein